MARNSESTAAPILLSGQWVAGEGEPIQAVNPADGTIHGTAGTASTAQVAQAVAAAAEALDAGGWSDLRPHQRSAVLHRISDLIRDRATDIA